MASQVLTMTSGGKSGRVPVGHHQPVPGGAGWCWVITFTKKVATRYCPSPISASSRSPTPVQVDTQDGPGEGLVGFDRVRDFCR